MYVEFLARSFRSADAIKNYVSGVRHMHKLLHINCESLDGFELNLMLRALTITMLPPIKEQLLITPDILRRLVHCCDMLPGLGSTIKCALLFAWFGFLRQSNLAPKSATDFDPRRHTCRGDVLQSSPGLVVMLKWSKTNQAGKGLNLIPLPEVAGNPLCPVAAYKSMLHSVPTRTQNDPLLMFSQSRKALTVSYSARSLKALTDSLCLPGLTFHQFRRSGAQIAYQAGVGYVHIKKHGTWASDAFWDYISREVIALSSPVPLALRQVVSACDKS